MARLIKIDKNGTKYYEGLVKCSRCDGLGVYIIGICNGQPVLSPVDGGICFNCGGTGTQDGKWKEYTPEYEAKLEERRRKRAEKLQTERAEEEAKNREAREALERAEAERQAEEEARIRAEKAKSQYVGSIGERIEGQAEYIKTASYERPSFAGFGTERVNIHIFKIDDNKVVWKTTASLGWWNERDEWETPQEGSIINLKGTVKEHSVYDEEKQTILTRCKVKK